MMSAHTRPKTNLVYKGDSLGLLNQLYQGHPHDDRSLASIEEISGPSSINNLSALAHLTAR